MQNSRVQTFSLIESFVSFPDQVSHYHCSCFHCLNNTKPLFQGRGTPTHFSQKRKRISNSKAYEFVVKEMTHGYSGRVQVPDVFILTDAILIYQNKVNNRPKMKEHQTNMEIKKHFEDQRRKIFTSVLFSSLLIIPEEPGMTIPNKPHKEVAILAYHDGTEQILTDTLLSKILDKRKNDPTWQGVSHVTLIPPQVKQPLTKLRYRYIRSADTLPQLTPLMEKLALQFDTLQEKNITSSSIRFENKLSFLKMQEEDQMEMSLNPQVKSLIIPSRKTKSMIVPKKRKHSTLLSEQVKPQIIKNECLELVAYMEVTTFVRILQADFQYFSDGSKIYLCNIDNYISEQLEGLELALIHDRYRTLEQMSVKDIAMVKQEYDGIESKELWKICAAMMKECLEFRKVELKLTDYKKPSQQTLLKIFMRIFPEFKPDQIFGSINWKNRLEAFVINTKTNINKTIREDEGIRILRRFGIEFRRTFN